MTAALILAVLVIVWLVVLLIAQGQTVECLRVERNDLRRQVDREKFLHQRFDGGPK